ncbi:substrate-binding periplasmic protein [Kiloniella litopenaei]|uniref:substrate-binding periplasmic protein n=1 Tax=Kiloniella litopenaei TaxID=1549748 RepID=UPI0012FF28DF|nr:transporter substrate-binding domain-containing protein [Kiloniella litopenaei]
MKLVTGFDYAPYASPSSPSGGVITEIVTTVFSEMGYRVSLGYYPWNRALKRVDRLNSDATFPFAYTDDRAEKFLYSDPVHHMKLSVFQNSGSQNHYSSPNDLIGLTGCEPLGYKTEIELVDLIKAKKINRFRAESVEDCLQGVASGRADFVVLSPSVAWVAANKLWKDNAKDIISESKVPLKTSTEHLVISKKHPNGQGLITEFNATFLKLKAKGVIQGIWTRHLGKDSPPVM